MQTRIPSMLLIGIILLWLAACVDSPATLTAETDDAAGLANPASVYCEEQGGRLELRSDDSGTYGVCTFDDGSECEEWAYFRGECAPGGSDAVTPSGGEISLADTDWQLVSLRGSPLLEGTRITISFEEARLSGFAGCNGYGGGPDSGKYTVTDEGGLSIPAFAITVMDCPSPAGVMDQEQAYVDALAEAAAYRLTGDGLEILNASGESILVYVQQEEMDMDPNNLLGTTWLLESLNGTRPGEGSSFTLVFHDAHRISGSAGCRDYVAVYEAEGEKLNIVFMAMLGAVCSEEVLLEREGENTSVLGWTDRFRLREGQLELLTARGESFLFVPLPENAAATLGGPRWSLLAFVEPNPVEDMPALLPLPTQTLSGSEITATFEDNEVQGSAGCNTYRAAFTRDGGALTIDHLEFTEMACLDPEGVLQQEDRYLGVLKDVNSGNVYGRQLWLETGDGRALVFGVPATE